MIKPNDIMWQFFSISTSSQASVIRLVELESVMVPLLVSFRLCQVTMAAVPGYHKLSILQAGFITVYFGSWKCEIKTWPGLRSWNLWKGILCALAIVLARGMDMLIDPHHHVLISPPI